MTAADIGLDDVPTPKVQAIRDLIAAGRTLIPVNGKIPTQKNWGSTKPGAYDETSLPLNYGVVLGDGDLVIDVDPRNFKKGDRPLARLIKDTGLDLKDTYVVYTGGGGLHAYLTIPLGVLVVNDLKEYPGIEFKSVGRQVVGPGNFR